MPGRIRIQFPKIENRSNTNLKTEGNDTAGRVLGSANSKTTDSLSETTGLETWKGRENMSKQKPIPGKTIFQE